MRRWSSTTVADRLDFSCGGRFGENPALVQLQQEGVARICNILGRNEGVAYLADEVGLGKTMQALGVISCLFADHPHARVLVIAPREVVQNGWKNEHERFRTYVAKKPMPGVSSFENLRNWLREFPSNPSISLLRHPSFSRPLYQSDIPWPNAVANLGLPNIRFRPHVNANPQQASWNYNLAFAEDVNTWLKFEHARFDLVVVDEAQCLRNLDGQQTNSVLLELLKDRVDRWLFLSATPAHSGVANIATVMNRYPGRGSLIHIPDDLGNNAKAVQVALKRYMVRRPRTFTVQGRKLHKRQYRLDDDTSLALQCDGSLDTLSIALTQKRLVGLLGQDGGYRFRTGYIASFESLEDSLRHRTSIHRPSMEAEDGDPLSEGTDFVGDRHVRSDSGQAPDEGFVTQISRDFSDRFGIGLPHPKIDGVERDLAQAAFGNGAPDKPGGVKTVVFCRRLSSVRILRERLMKRYLHGIEERCRSTWGLVLDWDQDLTPINGGIVKGEQSVGEASDAVLEETEAPDDNLNRLRVAQRPGKWLFNFRASFADGQRNALFFELNWFRWLCSIGGVDPNEAARAVPLAVWNASTAAATRSEKRYRREQARFLVWRCLEHHAQQVFRLDSVRAGELVDALRPILQDEQAEARAASAPISPDPTHPEHDLLLFESLWTRAESRRLLRLPAADDWQDIESIHWRKIVATVLSQYTRLSDVLIDLRCSEIRGASDNTSMLDVFEQWLLAGSADALRLLRVWRDWCEHYRLIFSSAVGDLTSQEPKELASQNSFPFLTNLDPVVGVTGGSGGHKLAVCQFNTPGMPYVMVGTDTIREGVNLHLFCDRVMHYGMPWTPGDLEQRIGRVDRFFGRIERRLERDGLSARLEITYPHLRDTIEARQIESLRIRRRNVEALVDDEFSGGNQEDGQFVEIDTPLRAPKKSRR